MKPLDLALILALAVLCGGVAQLTSAFSRKGWFLHIGLAFIGGFIGVWIALSFTLPTIYLLRIGKHDFLIVWALIGSVLFMAALGLLIKPRGR